MTTSKQALKPGIKFRILICFCLSGLAAAASGQVDIPTTTGFGGFFLTGPGVFHFGSNLLATGAPLLRHDAGKTPVSSIFDAPERQTSFAWLLASEANYTFSRSRTQIYLGNRLEDILRLDVPFGLGVRQELPDSSILGGGLLFTPAELKFWEDPYIEGEGREPADLNLPGVRLRWARILKTGLELTGTLRWYRYDSEKSGDWLVEQGRLAPSQQHLLVREGKVIRLQALYRVVVNRHRLSPAFLYIHEARDGAAMANKGYALRLNYLYFSPKVILDVNLVYRKQHFSSEHPVYGMELNAGRSGAAISAFFPVGFFGSKRWNIWLGTQFFKENSNAGFFDAQFFAFMGGLGWRFNRP